MLLYLYSFSVFVWMSENDSSTLRVDAYFFENGEKNLRFQKYPDTWTGPQSCLISGKHYQTRRPEWPIVVFESLLA